LLFGRPAFLLVGIIFISHPASHSTLVRPCFPTMNLRSDLPNYDLPRNDLPSNDLPSDSASDRSPAVRRTDMAQFVEFELNDQRYAFPIERIREIVILKNITPMPQVAAYVDGVTNLRGAIIPIINLRVLFGFDAKPVDDETRTIVVNVGEKTMGCTVDAVNQVLRVEKKLIGQAPETVTADDGGSIRGFVKVDERLVIILDVDSLLRLENLEHIKNVNLSI
jgi:purine-binding chemotaxis protein CheW